MATDRMYDLAFEYKRAKLWKRMYDTEVFAVRMPDGETGYCSVMGMLGEHIALAVYVGAQGFDTYRRMASGEILAAGPMALLSQDCLQCSFETKDYLQDEEVEEVRQYAHTHGILLRGAHAYPQFTKYVPNRYPWHIETEEDQNRMCEALEAGLALAEMLRTRRKAELGLSEVDEETETVPLLERDGTGFRLGTIPLPAPRPVEYPRPGAPDARLVSDVRGLDRHGILECELVRLGEPVREEDDEVPWFPALLLCADTDLNYVLPVPADGRYEDDPASLVRNFAMALTANKLCPQAVKVRNEETRALLEEFCMTSGILLSMDGNLPALDEAKNQLWEYLENTVGDDDEDDDGDDKEDPAMSEMVEAAREMCARLAALSDRDLQALPPELVRQLLQMAQLGLMPPELERRLRRLFPR